MLEIKNIRNNKDEIILNLSKRKVNNIKSIINDLIKLDDKRKKIKSLYDNLNSQYNQSSKEIGINIKEGKNSKIEDLKKQNSEIKEDIKKTTKDLKLIEKEIFDILISIPNVPYKNVPQGNKQENNEIVFESEAIKIENKLLPHWDLVKKHKIVDFELGNKITSAGFPVYINKGAKLQRALINYFLDEAIKKGYSEIQPPILINENSAFGTGQIPDKEGQMYKIENENLFLIPTAEVPITNIYQNTIIDTNDIPIKNVAYTPCFRKEAGSWGSHVRGLNRLHQFDKVEIVQIVRPEKSYSILDEMCNYVEGLLKNLKLPYRKIRLCSGDLGFTSAMTYDFEVFSPGQKKWLECSSVSNFETYQSNRANIKIKLENRSKVLAHTLNGSALALPRILASIIENYQSNNKIKIPKVLIPYTGFDEI
tara:strand:+ start:2645 stop:3913 length:1269 start_codon:yes stop_codon:yes gene_type:complete